MPTMPEVSGASTTDSTYATNFGILDKGPGFTGECPDVTGMDTENIPIIVNNVYCIIFESTPPNSIKLWIRTTWNGVAFANTTIAYDTVMLPVELQLFDVE